jgi:hypothetical protein
MMADHRFVLDCLLGVSAAHHHLVKPTTKIINWPLFYRGEALKGLQIAINTFSKDNADAILAASHILTWYNCDWYLQSYSLFPNAKNIIGRNGLR